MREREGAKDKRVDKPAENEAARKREIHTINILEWRSGV
jgi:hypothetical protein